MPELIPDLNKRRKITLVHNYAEGRNDEIRDRFQELVDRIATRVTIERSHSLAPGVLTDVESDGNDELLLGGGTNRLFDSDPELKAEVFDRIRRLGRPAVGICFGYQAIGRAYGAGLEKMPERRNGLVPVTLDAPLGDMPGDAEFDARVIHSWTLSELPSGLTVVAHDDLGNPQAIVHNERPAGGVQYHPEINPDAQPGAVEAFGAVREEVLKRQDHDRPAE